MKKSAFSIIFLLHLTIVITAKQLNSPTCDRAKCPGPLAYYRGLKCTPKYRKSGDCCAYMYDCNHLKNRSPNKCYANGHEYEIEESLREEDSLPCDYACTCKDLPGSGVGFNCAMVDCPAFDELGIDGFPDGCYLKYELTECCPTLVCPSKPEDRPTCEVDGEIYGDGENFIPKLEPEKTCICSANYTGENIKPFCIDTQETCRPDFDNVWAVTNKCAPFYYPDQSPQTSCNIDTRCPNPRDKVIRNANIDPDKSDVSCYFGTLMLRYGDQLNDARNSCEKCVCEVGPFVTCQQLPSGRCDANTRGL